MKRERERERVVLSTVSIISIISRQGQCLKAGTEKGIFLSSLNQLFLVPLFQQYHHSREKMGGVGVGEVGTSEDNILIKVKKV